MFANRRVGCLHCKLVSTQTVVFVTIQLKVLQLFPWERHLPAAYQSKAQTLMGLFDERKRLSIQGAHPMSPEVIALREQLSRFSSQLIRETFCRAIRKTGGS